MLPRLPAPALTTFSALRMSNMATTRLMAGTVVLVNIMLLCETGRTLLENSLCVMLTVSLFGGERKQ